MQRLREQNATQKLLDLIRGDRPLENSTTPENTGSQDPLPKQQGKALSFGFPAKHLNLGVFINQTHIILALTTDRGPALKKVLIQWQTIPIPEGQSPGTHDFPGILNRCIGQFLGGEKKVPVWCALDSALLKLKQLTIPDLPTSKIANAAFWGLKKEAGFNENLEILDFEVRDKVMVDGIQKKQILAYSVPKTDVTKLKKTFSRAGFPLTGITAIPFAMQNFVRTGQIPSDHDYFALVNISWDNSEVFCFSKAGIILVRSLRTGSLNLVEDLDIPKDADPIDFLSTMNNPDIKAYPGMQEPAERLISKIFRTGDYCAQNYTGNTPLQHYTFYGHFDQCTPFMNQVAAMIQAPVTTFKPEQDSLPSGMEAGLPRNAEKRNQVLTAFAIALSDNRTTPNFLYTFSDRERAAKERKITLATVALGLILLAGAGAAHLYLNTSIAKSRATLATIRQEQTQFGQGVSEASISRAIDLVQIKTRVTRNYVRSYLPLAVVSEICRHTPGHIKLSGLTYTRKPGKKEADAEKKQLTLKGRVTAHPYSLDASLGNYIITLSESPVFGDIEIQNKKVSGKSGTEDEAILTFTAILEVI